MDKLFDKEILKYSQLGKDLLLTREFQKFRVDQSDIVLFFITLFAQPQLKREHVYYLIFNAYIISELLANDRVKHLSIVLLNDKLDRLFVVNYRGKELKTIDQSHCVLPKLVTVVVHNLIEYFTKEEISNETSLLAVAAVESVIENFYELRN